MTFLACLALALILVGSLKFAYAIGRVVGVREMRARFLADLDAHLLTIEVMRVKQDAMLAAARTLQATLDQLRHQEPAPHERSH